MRQTQMTTPVASMHFLRQARRKRLSFCAKRETRGEGLFFLVFSSSRASRKMLRSPCLAHEAAVMQVNTHVTEGCSNCNLYKAQKFKCPHVFFFLRNPTKRVQKYSNNFSGAVFTRSNELALACRWTSNIRSYARSIAVRETESISIF